MRSVSMWLNLYGCQAVRHKPKKGVKPQKMQFTSFLSLRRTAWTLDTGHFFNTSLIQGLVFKGIVKGQESKVWAFFKGLRSFRGPQKQNWKNDQNSIIFGAKIKVRINFIWEKLMEFLLLNEVLKNWIFFQMPIKKVTL